MWTEFIETQSHAEYMMFPRLSALAEVVWSPAASRDFRDFRHRLKQHFLRLDRMQVSYRSVIQRPVPEADAVLSSGTGTVVFEPPLDDENWLMDRGESFGNFLLEFA